MADVVPFRRPIRWEDLRTDEAETVIHERAQDSSNVIIGEHAYDRVDERSIIEDDVHLILQTGTVHHQPKRTDDDCGWEVIIQRRLAGSRWAGVVSVILSDHDKVFVRTVEWMDQ